MVVALKKIGESGVKPWKRDLGVQGGKIKKVNKIGCKNNTFLNSNERMRRPRAPFPKLK